MKSRTDGFKSMIESIKGKQSNFFKTGEDWGIEGGATAKTCPGILGLFSQSFLLKSPTDIVITVDGFGGYVFDTSDNSIVEVSSHDRSQFYQEDNTFFKDKTAIKFELLVKIKTTGFGYILTNPTYHSKSPFYVPIGYMIGKFTNNQDLNLIAFIDTPKEGETKTVVINQGDVLAYLVPFEKCSLSFSDENFIAKRFKMSFNVKNWFND